MEGVFSLKHIIGLVWVTAMIVGLYLLSNRLRKKKGIGFVLRAGAVFLIAMELIKYVYLIVRGQWDMSYIPLHFCSLMLYIYPVIAFFPKTKIAKRILPFAFSGGIIAGLIALILPTNILGDPGIPWLSTASFLPIVSFIYHGVMVWYSSWLAYSRHYVPRYRDTLNMMAFVFFFAIIAMVVNVLFNQDFMMLREGAGNPLAFLLAYHYAVYILAQIALALGLNSLLIFIVRRLQRLQRWR